MEPFNDSDDDSDGVGESDKDEDSMETDFPIERSHSSVGKKGDSFKDSPVWRSRVPNANDNNLKLWLF